MMVYAHRGGTVHAPQNTLAAFESAYRIGADGVETDVHPTRDGEVVVCHNYFLSEASNGKGLVYKRTLAELRKLDFGIKYAEEFKGTRIPTLDEFLAHAARFDTGTLNIEIKIPRVRGTDIVRKTVEAVRRHGLTDRLVISSFDHRILAQAKRLEPRCRTAYLSPTPALVNILHMLTPLKTAKSVNADCYHPSILFTSARQIRRAHAMGLEVNVWTINSPKDMQKSLRYGADGIITDDPEAAFAFFAAGTQKATI